MFFPLSFLFQIFKTLSYYIHLFSMPLTSTNISLFLIVSLLFLSSPVSTYDPITPDVMDNLLNIIDQYFFVPTPSYFLQIRKFLRAAFHDCMGGCDGSLNLFQSQNRGLEILIERLDLTYSARSPNFTYISNYLSRADFLVLTEQRALAWGWRNYGQVPTFLNNTPSFVYGRVSNPFGMNNDNLQASFPDGIANWTLPASDTNHPTTILQGLLNGLPGVSQYDIVALLGIHGCGGLNMNNSGYNGPWLSGDLLANSISNQFYKALYGVGAPKAYMFQTPSNESNVNGANPSRQYYSPDPTPNKIQWNAKGPTAGKIFLNADLLIYHNFTASKNGTVQGKYCSQGFNTTLFDCSKNGTDKTYMPLSRNAIQGFNYSQNNLSYLNDLLPAFLRLVNVTNEFTNVNNLRGFYPTIVVVNGKNICKGDIFFNNCGLQ